MGTTISGSYTSSLTLNQIDQNPATVTGTIAVSGAYALYGNRSIAWNITNAGLLKNTANGGFGVLLPGGTITNASTGRINAGGGNGIQLAATVFNAGLISAGTDAVYGARYVENLSDGTVIGGNEGVNLASGSVVNAGLIEGGGTYGAGVVLQADGSVTNQSGGTIAASGMGVQMSSSGGTVVNDGLISASSLGVTRATSVINHDQGTITGGKDGLSLSGATVVNAGSIIGSGAESAGILLQSSGAITNLSSGVISGLETGVNISGGAGTVVNAGYIGGATDALAFGTGYANSLVIIPGAVFNGTVDGGGYASTMTLATGGAGTLTGLGSRYIGFGEIIVDDGADWTFGGSNTIAAGVTLAGAAITLAAGGTLELAGTIASGETVVFGGSGATLLVDSGARMAGAVAQLGSGDEIDLAGVTASSLSYSDGTLKYIASDGSAASIDVSVVSGVTPELMPDGAGGAEFAALCFCRGSLIATPSGEVPVERLAVGDSVLTFSGIERKIIWVGKGRVLAARGRRTAATPVIVRKGAFAENVPHHDLRVTKGHAFWFNGILIPVEFLVNHRSILWDDRAQEVELYHLELDCHDVLIANGAAAESYRDDGNRWLFSNANSGWGLPALPACAPVVTGGPEVDAVWHTLLERAGPRPGLPLTDDPGLYLRVDGQRVDPAWRHGSVCGFRLAQPSQLIRIMSRSGVPQELGHGRDARSLGVAVKRIVFRRAAQIWVVEADDRRLNEGFHDFEPDNAWRWTSGEALLRTKAFPGAAGATEIEIHLGGSTAYPLLQSAA